MTVMSRVPGRRSNIRRSSFVAPADYVPQVPDALSWRERLDHRAAPKGSDAWTAASVTEADRTVVDAGPYGVIDIATPDPHDDRDRWPHLGVVWWDKRSFSEEDRDVGVVQTDFAPTTISDHVSLSLPPTGRPADMAPPTEAATPMTAAPPAVASAVPEMTAVSAPHRAPVSAPVAGVHGAAAAPGAPQPSPAPAAFAPSPPLTDAPFAPPLPASIPVALDEGRRSHVRRSRHAAPGTAPARKRSRVSYNSHPRRARLRRRRLRRRIVLGGILVIVAFVTTIVVQTALLTPFMVPSASMEGSLKTGDRILVNKLAYAAGSVQRGDVVVFRDPGGWLTGSPEQTNGDDFLVKRVIAVAGDHVSCCSTSGRVTVNGVELFEPYANIGGDQDSAAMSFDVTVPAGALWVLGDNRHNSRDSSQTQSTPSHGFVPVANVVGQATFDVWPLDRVGPIDQAKSTFASVPDQTCTI
jgi:signal peptidase I